MTQVVAPEGDCSPVAVEQGDVLQVERAWQVAPPRATDESSTSISIVASDVESSKGPRLDPGGA